jgi:hypothetical protein
MNQIYWISFSHSGRYKNSTTSWDVLLRGQVEFRRRFGGVSKASNQQEASRKMKTLLQCTPIIPEPDTQLPGSNKV